MRAVLISLIGLFLAGTCWGDDFEVDVELFLAVDVSRSMSPDELEIQRRGYADALTHPEVLAAINHGMLGRIAVTYVEWAGDYAQREVVPWSLLANAADARRIADQIAATQTEGLYRTSISSVLLHAGTTFEGNGFEGLRRVIDVSGDGPNNQGLPVTQARDRVLAEGIIINGLPLMTRDALDRVFGIEDLDDYYRNCVIGGPGSFVVPVLEWSEFADAVKRKLILEIASRPARLHLAQLKDSAPYDCLIGEKLWERNRGYFQIP